MKLLITRSRWEFADLPLEDFLTKIGGAGFDGTDIHLPSLVDPPERVRDLHNGNGLLLYGMITTEGRTPEEHQSSLERGFALAARAGAVQLNCHTGKDYFPLEKNLAIFRRSFELSREYGIPVSHETHRGRALFSTVSTAEILDALPELRLTADFSHWCCVHESMLEDQRHVVDRAIQRTDYLHARVGQAEGPQVSDPRAPEWQAAVEAHLGWWKRIAANKKQSGAESLAVCPEFGPPPYMPALPFTRQPLADLWEITLWMKDLLKKELE